MTSSDPEQLALARRVRCARMAAGLIQQAVADQVRIGRVAVADIEAGRRRLYVDEAVRLARALCVRVADLLGVPSGDVTPPTVRQLVTGLSDAQVEQVAAFAEFLLRRARQTGRPGGQEVRGCLA